MSYHTHSFDDQVIELLQAGGVGFMPSDTIYGLSCRAMDEQAVERIYRLKQRDSNKPLIVLIATISQLTQLGVNAKQTDAVKQYWPGAITQICDAPDAPAWLERGTKSLAIRMPNNKELCDLITATGPLISTSANVQNDKPASSIEEAQNYFGGQLDFYVDAGDLSGRQSSTLVRIIDGNLEVIRPGAVKIES